MPQVAAPKFTGGACPKCKGTLRYVVSKHCVRCRADANQRSKLNRKGIEPAYINLTMKAPEGAICACGSTAAPGKYWCSDKCFNMHRYRVVSILSEHGYNYKGKTDGRKRKR